MSIILRSGRLGGFAQDGAVAFAAGGFRGVVEGAVFAVGERRHEVSSKRAVKGFRHVDVGVEEDFHGR